mgnify:CR=1 FL=1
MKEWFIIMEKNNWLYISPFKFSESSILSILEKLNYSKHKILYRFNDATWDETEINNPIIKNMHPNYENTDIFDEKNLRFINHDFSHELMYGPKIPMLNYKWYQIQPEDAAELLNPIKHGSLNIMITDDLKNIYNYLFYINIYEANDFVFAINFNNIPLQEKECLWEYIQKRLLKKSFSI